MTRPHRKSPHFVVCVDNGGYPASVELHKIYRVVPDREAAREGHVRVVDERGEDYLYPARWFAPKHKSRGGEREVNKRPAENRRGTAL